MPSRRTPASRSPTRTPRRSPRSGRLGSTSRRRAAARAVDVPRASLEALQERIGIAFRDPTLLQEALTHSSFANETPSVSPRDNERLEYLGDAVLQLITAEYLYKYRPAANEGELTQTRSAMVNTNTLAALSEDLGVGDFLFLGKGIAKGGGRSLKSLLANAFEAILGAVFLDAGYDAAYHFYLDRFRRLPDPVKDENHKGRLQQVVQERFNQTPYYDSGGGRTAGHRREYTAVVFAGSEALGTGHGATKQEAEQSAAKNALGKLLGETAEAAGTARREGASRRRRRGRTERPEAEVPAEPAEDVTPSEVAEVLAEEEAVVEGVQPLAPTEEPLAEPVAEKPRRRRSTSRRRAPARDEAPPEPAEPGPVAEPEAAAEPAPAAEEAAPAKPRRRAPSRRRKPAAPAAEPEPPPAAEAAPEPPRSRQFGEPLGP